MKDMEIPPPLVSSPKSTTTQLSSRTSSSWNTDNLILRLLSDATSAASAGLLIAPIISLIDRSIMENASGASPLLTSIKSSIHSLLSCPHTVLLSRPTRLIFLLYSGTYLTANTIDTISSTVSPQNLPPSHTTSGTSKFIFSSAANVSLCIYKDQAFVRMFGPPGIYPPRPVPPASYALFALRDMLTVFASFNVPPLLAPYLESRELRSYMSGLTAAQFIAPAAVQIVSTPLHLLGLDLYNRPGTAVSWVQRWDQVRTTWLPSAAARICRIVPAFGVGGVVNTKVRRNLMERL